MIRPTLPAGVVLATMLAGAPALAAEPDRVGARTPEISAETPVVARVAVAHVIPYAPKVLVTGDLKPEQSAQLAFGVPGTLARIEVRRGQLVRAGDVLAAVDDAAARATLQQADAGLQAAEAQVSAAEVQLRIAEDAVARLDQLKAANGATEMQLVQAQGQRDAAKSGVAGARAQVLVVKAQREQAAVHARNHVLKAPFAGLVTKVPDGSGMVIGPGVPLFALEATGTLLLETSVTIDEASQLRTGTRIEVVSSSTRSTSKDAVIRSVLPSADVLTHRVPVQIAVPNRDGRFIAHSFARATLPLGAERPIVKVPAGALVQRGGSYALWLVDADERVRQARVRLRAQEGEAALVEPEEGRIPEGTRVIDLPPGDLVEGRRLAPGSVK